MALLLPNIDQQLTCKCSPFAVSILKQLFSKFTFCKISQILGLPLFYLLSRAELDISKVALNFPHIKYTFLACLNNVQKELLYFPWHWHGCWSQRPQMLKFYVKVFRTSLFPNPMIYLAHDWYADRYLSNILHNTIPTPLHDIKVKVTDLENFYVKVLC